MTIFVDGNRKRKKGFPWIYPVLLRLWTASNSSPARWCGQANSISTPRSQRRPWLPLSLTLHRIVFLLPSRASRYIKGLYKRKHLEGIIFCLSAAEEVGSASAESRGGVLRPLREDPVLAYLRGIDSLLSIDQLFLTSTNE